MPKSKPDPRVTKRRVTMVNTWATEEPDPDRDGQTRIATRTHTAVDYVDGARPGLLEAYVADAKRRWQLVTVSDGPDAGPAGYDGPTFVPFGTPVAKVDGEGRPTGDYEWHELPHELAGSFFPATDCKNCKHAPEHPLATVAREQGRDDDPHVGVTARTIRVEG